MSKKIIQRAMDLIVMDEKLKIANINFVVDHITHEFKIGDYTAFRYVTMEAATAKRKLIRSQKPSQCHKW